jgi:hypothetical protein
MTWPRLFDLARLRKETHGEELYDVGLAFNFAMNEPKHLKSILQESRQWGEHRVGQVTGMLKIPGKRG